MQHVPKKHLDFENPISNNPNKIETKSRIFGENQASEMSTETKTIGTGRNPADSLPKVGKKQQDIEKLILQQVAEEIKEKLAFEDSKKNIRHFETTNKSIHDQKDLQQNVVDRRVMWN